MMLLPWTVSGLTDRTALPTESSTSLSRVTLGQVLCSTLSTRLAACQPTYLGAIVVPVVPLSCIPPPLGSPGLIAPRLAHRLAAAESFAPDFF